MSGERQSRGALLQARARRRRLKTRSVARAWALFSFAQSPISADKTVGVGALSFGVRRHILVRSNEACA